MMIRVLKTVCLLLSLSLNAVAESRPEPQLEGRPGRGDILLEDFGSYGLRWEPQMDFEEATLRVAGRQGLVWEGKFYSGDELTYDVLDLDGFPLPGGAYTYEWRMRSISPEEEEYSEMETQSGRFQIQGGLAASLEKPLPGEAFPLVTNPAGNHFVGNLTTDATLCVGCADGDSADVSIWDATIRSKGTVPAIILDEDNPDELWLMNSTNGEFALADLATGDETVSTVPFTIQDNARSYSFLVASSGDIGLGTSTPASSLHVMRDDGTAEIFVENAAATAAVRTMFRLENNGAPRFAVKNAASGVEWSFQQSGPGNFLISLEGTGGPEMQVYKGGRVRMGPAGAINFDLDPGGNLKIKGSLTANGSTFPDYVFEPNYDLMPLTDLQEFIDHNKRLPDIPSAEEVQRQGGHNMTELQLKLLEKIEELTLYTLEQEQKLQEMELLKRRTSQMEAENALMKARLAVIESLVTDR